MLLDKEHSDEALLLSTNHDLWYTVDMSILEPEMRSTFHPSYFDQETEQFISQSAAISNSLCLQLYYSIMSTLLSLLFVAKTSINGLLNRGGMFIFSNALFRNFVGLPDDWSPLEKRMLDLGAGDGGVTYVLSNFYKSVSATDASKVMEWRLAQKGFQVLPIDGWKHTGPYDLISALNLLDRHFNPIELLAELHQVSFDSNCLVLVSVVLPLRPFVEFNPKNQSGRSSTMPVSSMSVNGIKFEDHVNTLIRNTFQPAGFEVIRWTKLPYLCEGDFSQAYYKLDDAVFLLRPVAKASSSTYSYPSSSTSGSSGLLVQIHDET